MSMKWLSPVRDERGFTLVELLVAMALGLIVSFAAFAILDTSLSQSTRIADRVSADQNIILNLHSSWVAPETTPVETGSEGNKLLIVSQTGSEASFSKVTLHEIRLENGKLLDTSYLNTEAKPAPNWEFSKTATGTQALLTGVTQSENSKKELIPIFQYYKYEGSELSKTPLKTPLTAVEAGETAAITVGFTSAPESGTIGKIAGDRTVDLANTVVLRFRPASTSVTNLPCA
jgi:prepilin-type N-terminal cleavage/methylation domain-containing protein